MPHTEESPRESPQEPALFIPKGSIAFFLLLVLLCGAIWFAIYFIMLQRA